jgi:hypothetical protein
MSVEDIFTEALAKKTPLERAAYLDDACAHDTALRDRVETLLRSHEATGAFLGKPAIQIAAEELAGQALGEKTEAEAASEDRDIRPSGRAFKWFHTRISASMNEDPKYRKRDRSSTTRGGSASTAVFKRTLFRSSSSASFRFSYAGPSAMTVTSCSRVTDGALVGNNPGPSISNPHVRSAGLRLQA